MIKLTKTTKSKKSTGRDEQTNTNKEGIKQTKNIQTKEKFQAQEQ
jgi:hypothetical protein